MLRKDKGMSLRRLAEASFVAKSYIAELESGTKTASEDTARALDNALGAGGELIRLAREARWDRSVNHSRGGGAVATLDVNNDEWAAVAEVDEMNRRGFLSASIALPLAAAAPNVNRKVGAEEADQIRSTVPHLYQLDDQVGGQASVRRHAAYCLHHADSVLQGGSYSAAVGTELQIAYGELAEMVGWLAFDGGQLHSAQFHLGEALRAAQLAQDPNLEVLALASMGSLAVYMNRPREAVALVQLAQRRAAKGLPSKRLMSLLHAREAVAWAQLGDAVASQRALVQADAFFAPNVAASDPAWIGFFGVAELHERRATSSWYLSKVDDSINQMELAVEGLDGRLLRNRAYYSVLFGNILVHAGDLTRACEVVKPALSLFGDVGSYRARKQLQKFLASLESSTSNTAIELLSYVRDQTAIDLT